MARRGSKRVKVLITLPDALVKDVDQLAEDCDDDRSTIIEEMLEYCLDDTEIITELFGELEKLEE